MNALLYILPSFALGAIIVFLLLKSKLSNLESLKDSIQSERDNERMRMQNIIDEKEARIDSTEQLLRKTMAEKYALEREVVLVREQNESEKLNRERAFSEQIKLVQEQLQRTSQEALKLRSEELSMRNSEQMGAIISPLKDTIREMKDAMVSTRDTHNRNTASLEKVICEMMNRTMQIGAEADKLAHALRNETKVQGNWGEMILDEILENQGLKLGVHYDKQVTLRDNSGKAILNEESGKKMIPDTILHYPDNKDAVIDSKVSLSAFVDYQNAENDEEKEDALRRHIKSVRQHVQELSRKDYSSYIKSPRQALNYVIMFVPNEGALQLALANAPELWREAFSKGVFITGEQNLIAALRIIQIAWTQQQQAQNQEAIFDTARMLLDRVADFISFHESMGQKLQDATNFYVKSSEKLRDGRLSVVGAANKLIKLGAKTSQKKTIPEENEPLLSSASVRIVK